MLAYCYTMPKRNFAVSAEFTYCDIIITLFRNNVKAKKICGIYMPHIVTCYLGGNEGVLYR